MDKKIIKMELVLEVSDGKGLHTFDARLAVKGKDVEGNEWKNSHQYGGASVLDAIDSVVRHRLLPQTIVATATSLDPDLLSSLTKVLEPVVSEVEKSETPASGDAPEKKESVKRGDSYYVDLERRLLTLKHGTLRYYCSERGLQTKVATNRPIPEIVKKIVEEQKSKDSENEKNLGS